MEESTQEDNQTNERFSINFYSPIKYEKQISNTQPGETRNLKQNLFALGDRNILISSSPKITYDSSVDESNEEKQIENNTKETLASNHDRKRLSVSDLDKSLSIDIQQHGFPAQIIQIGEKNTGAITQPHKNLNHIFISLNDQENTNRHIKNVKSDLLINQNLQKTFDDLLKRKENKENQAKSTIELTKKQLLDSFFNIETEKKKTQLNQKEALATIYENNQNENSQLEIATSNNINHEYIKNKYKRERKKKSSIFSSEDLRISNTQAINIKESEFIFNSPIINKMNKSKIYEEDKEQLIPINHHFMMGNANVDPIDIQTKKLMVQKAEVLNIIMIPKNSLCTQMKLQINKQKHYSMAIGAKLSFETLREENTKQVMHTESKDKLHSKANSSIPSYQIKSVRQLNFKKITIKPNTTKRLLNNYHNDYSSNKIPTLSSTNPIKLKFIKKTNNIRNISNPNKSQLKEKVTNKQEIIQFVLSNILKYKKKTDKNNIIQLLMKSKEGCYVILTNQMEKTINSEHKQEMYLFKGLYQYNQNKNQIEKIYGETDCPSNIQKNEVITKLRIPNTAKQYNLPCGSNLIMINNI